MKPLSMFPSREESKAFLQEDRIVSQVLRVGKTPMDYLIKVNKLLKKNG